MIYYSTPFSITKNLGRAYNDYMQLLPTDDDWMCFIDADVIVLTPNFQKQIQELVDEYPHTGVFTCLTNRVGNQQQCYQKRMCQNSDIEFHQNIANKLYIENYGKIRRLNKNISGVLMVIQKKVWAKVGGFKESGILMVDSIFSRKVLRLGRHIYLMQGIYCYHWYRGLEGKKQNKHLKK